VPDLLVEHGHQQRLETPTATDLPVILAGRMDNPDLALRALDEGAAEIISLGRPALAAPEIVNKICAQRPAWVPAAARRRTRSRKTTTTGCAPWSLSRASTSIPALAPWAPRPTASRCWWTGEEILIPADTNVSAVGYTAAQEFWQAVQDSPLPKHIIGDARRVSNIMYAIWDAYEVASRL